MCRSEVILGGSSEFCRIHGRTDFMIILKKNGRGEVIGKEKCCKACQNEKISVIDYEYGDDIFDVK